MYVSSWLRVSGVLTRREKTPAVGVLAISGDGAILSFLAPWCFGQELWVWMQCLEAFFLVLD
jgi:hypothetical protein